jgi:hypothetical protein
MCVGAGFPRPIARVTDQGGENPPLRCIAWLRLIFKGHNSSLRGAFSLFQGVAIFGQMITADHYGRFQAYLKVRQGRPVNPMLLTG